MPLTLSRVASRAARHLVFSAVALVLACGSPTGSTCDCPPGLSAVVVRGRVVDASDQPVAGAILFADGVPRTFSSEPPFTAREAARTDADGAFVVRAFSTFSADTLAVRADVGRPGMSALVRVRLGDARFRDDRGRLDTVHVTVRLP